jgi:hypothetical protein
VVVSKWCCSGNYRRRIIAGFFSVLLLVSFSGACLAEDADSRCTIAKDKWEQIVQDLKEKLKNYATVQQIPVERITQKPIVERASGKTIAKQISEALQVKDDMLNARRKECRNLITQENQAFSELQECINHKNIKDKDLKNMVKNRQSFLEKAVVALAEVREVEGKETFSPYADAGYDPDAYNRSVNNRWQNYQQMYRQWWGR